MKSLYLECSAGISGDMLVGALIDLGADKAAMDLALSSMPVKGFTYNITRVKKAGISCCDFNVILDSEHENNDHDMGYLHGEFTRKENAEAEQTCACDATRKQEDVYEHPHMPENDYRLDHGNEGAYQDGFVNEHDYMHEHELPVAHEFLEAHQPHKLSSYLADHAEEEKECDCAHPEHHHHEHAEEAKPHEHHHHHEHRGLKEITAIINETEMTENARTIALAIFDIIAEAEAKAHDVPKDEVHFHEVGALDSIVDIIAIAVLYDSLGVDHGITSPLAEGRGQIRCQHGLLPIPVPAVANICSTYGLILDRLPCEGEFVTPTGAAAVVALCDTMIVPDRHMILGTGYGSGKRNYECPSILRAMLLDSDDYEYTLEEGTHKPAEQDDEKSCASGLDNLQKLLEVKFGYEEAAPETEPIFKLETNIDDTTGEILGYVLDKLLEAGALDACYLPIFMKKNRPAYQLQVLCRVNDVAKLETIIYNETSTIGIRRCIMERSFLQRHEEVVNTMYGPIKVKVSETPAGERYAVEYESAVAAAKQNKVPLIEVYREVDANFT
ncbi:MAG: LarC family nickel insertion protein [Phascolarctobacterium sp.]|nr:LarC family nickel insertion protein [Phascolarctobacterium sp.]